jgi:hypothetical protein
MNNPDRLYDLLPAIYRLRDADRGYPLRDLLRVVARQVDIVENDITQLYDNWFIETAQDWAVPYIADLVGYTPVHAAGDPAASAPEENRILIPRREVANTIAYRRRRGTLSVLEDLARSVAAWPARAVEFFRLLVWTQNLNHQHTEGHRARVASLRDANELDKIGTPFDPFARSVDIRRISSLRAQGRYNIPSVGVWVWRLQSCSLTRTPAYHLDAGKSSYTFSVLGNDAPLFANPLPEPHSDHIAGELNVPSPIRRRGLATAFDDYYGDGKSFSIWADWAGHGMDRPLPSSVLVAADLSNWTYAPPDGFVAVDPQLGRIQFPINQIPRRAVWVSYRYAFSADIGGGEYPRPLTQREGAVVYEVGESSAFKKIGEALDKWKSEAPEHAVIEIADSRAYVEPVNIVLGKGQSLQLRAANRRRPVIRLLDWQTEGPDSLSVTMGESSEFTLDGLLITGRGVSVSGAEDRSTGSPCAARLTIRHCTLVPGWSLDGACQPTVPNKESLETRNVRAQIAIHQSILGPIEVHEDEVHSDPIPIEISDSIVDAMDGERPALIGPQARHAHAVLTVKRSTVWGIVQVHAVKLAENSIFNDCVYVARRQIGCMRFCYVAAHCRTPRRYGCQPDLVLKREGLSAAARQYETERVRPHYTARRYGMPAYAQLSLHCAREILEGASDGSEMGVFHDLFQPQRFANLRARLEEFTPAGMDAGVLIAN